MVAMPDAIDSWQSRPIETPPQISSADSYLIRQQCQIRQLLLEWRDYTALRLGFHPDHPNWCARHSIILHDIYVDAIAAGAPEIHTLDDLRRIAFYWKWIDEYGAQVFYLIRDFLDASPKRTCYDVDDDASLSPAKRVRHCR